MTAATPWPMLGARLLGLNSPRRRRINDYLAHNESPVVI